MFPSCISFDEAAAGAVPFDEGSPVHMLLEAESDSIGERESINLFSTNRLTWN